MTPFPRRLALALAVTAATPACGDIASPERQDLYEWRLFLPAAGGAATDTVSFHWGQADLPVRIWVEDADGLPGHAARAIEVWQSVLLYREFRGVLVDDSTTADVVVRGSPAPEVVLGAARLHSALAPQCSGATDLDISEDHTQLRLPIRVFVDPVLGPDEPSTQTCLALTTIHELGHALGIFSHSPNASDIMFADPAVELPSVLDRGTLEATYHFPPTLAPVRP